eukprot:jgi/Chlat1/4387/Chrsp29S04527
MAAAAAVALLPSRPAVAAPSPLVHLTSRGRWSGPPLQLQSRRTTIRAAMTETAHGIKVESNPSESKLAEMGVRSWPKWGCEASVFPWTYSATETCYLLQGDVYVRPDGAKEAVRVRAGDLAVFPKDLSCTWDVREAVDKHYKFE